MPNNVSIKELLPGIILVGAIAIIMSFFIYGAISGKDLPFISLSPKEYEIPRHYTEEIK